MSEALQSLILDATALAKSRRAVPRATYRLQMHAGFPIRAAREITPYLYELGISHVYTSSLLAARPGSLHGYDVCNHGIINPELGTEEEFLAWSRELRDRGMGLILDVVPNHMCVSGENAWWNDVLENGPSSPFSGYFDIDWSNHPRERLNHKVLLPVLGETYGAMLEAGKIQLRFRQGAFLLEVYERVLPIDPRTYRLILNPVLESAKKDLGARVEPVIELMSILTSVSHLPPRTEHDADRIAVARVETSVIRRRLAEQAAKSPRIMRNIQATLDRFNGTPGDAASFGPLDELLEAQAYRLSFWRVASDEINYRRFFDVNDLAALSNEREEVFEATHRKIFHWLGVGLVDGIRIDHPDGLYDPEQYLRRLQVHYLIACAEHLAAEAPERYAGVTSEEIRAALQERFADGPLEPLLYVVVEKILGPNEQLPANWITDGTTGYEFLNQINGLFVDGSREADATWNYHQFTGMETPFNDLVYRSKFLVLQSTLAGELQMLAHQLDRLAQGARWSRDFTLNSLRRALREVIACFPIYRTYITEKSSDTDTHMVTRACRLARLKNPTLGRSVFEFIRDTLLLKDPPGGPASEEYRDAQRRFAGKFQQVTAPVTAKGYEDTALYVYNRFVSLNEVGGEPSKFGYAPARVHGYFRERAENNPAALSPLSTHDTKRSEDMRARLNVLSEMPEAWAERLIRWDDLNAAFRAQFDEETVAPDENEEYLLYQTLLGVWPASPPTDEEREKVVERVQAYMNKALHEAKEHSSWINPNPEYDAAVEHFVREALSVQHSETGFLTELNDFAQRIARLGGFNSLSQTLIRCTAPGVPDTYQGTEAFDLSLVDPDNRRPVDYTCHGKLLAQLAERSRSDRLALARDLACEPNDAAKIYVLSESLKLRQRQQDLFEKGRYEAIEVEGDRAEHVFAFLREGAENAVMVVVPRLMAALCPKLQPPLGPAVWSNTRLVIPDRFAGRMWRNVYTGESDGRPSSLAKVLAHFPVALLELTDREPAGS